MNSGTSKKTLSSEELQQMYEVRFEGRLEYRNIVWRVLIRDYFQQFIHRNDVVLDLGAGYGEFINNVTCQKKYAMDLNPDTALRSRADVEVLQQDCSQRWPLLDNSLDVVFTSNFFEHLPDKEALAHTLVEAKRCLKQGGRLIAMGPNITYCGDAYWDVVDHHIPLSDETLSLAFVQAGLNVEECIDKFMPFTMSEGPQYPTFFVAMYLRIPLVWRVFGKQFLVVAKKP